MPAIKINENIRKYRKEMGIGQEALANALGVTIQAVSKWETSGSMPDITLLPQIAEFFGVTLEELFYGRKEDAPELIIEPMEKVHEEENEKSPVEEPSETYSGQSDEQPGEQQETRRETRSYSWNDLSDLGKTIGSSISEQVRRFTEEVRENVSGRNFHINLGSDRWTAENKVRSDLPDDKILRVVQFYGNEMVQADEVCDSQPIRLVMPDTHQTQIHKVIIYGNAEITGAIGGSLSADGDVRCGNVGGSVQSDSDINCQSVGGSVTADGNVQCSNVGGSVTSDENVTCGNVMGNITADGNVTCASVRGSVRCDGKVYINQ